MRMRTYHDEVKPKLLAQGASSYTQVFTKALSDCERVVWMAIGHASANIAFNVTIATDSSGTSPTDVATGLTLAAGKVYTIEIGPGVLTAAKQYVSPKLTVTAGTFTLLEQKFSLRYAGNITHDTTYGGHESLYNAS